MIDLLDTTVFVDLLRGGIEAKKFLKSLPEVHCSVVTAAELYRGALDKESQRKIEKLLAEAILLPITPQIGKRMLELIKTYGLSHNLAIPDALIAASATEEGYKLVTSNLKHFKFIPGLKLRDWAEVKKDFDSTD